MKLNTEKDEGEEKMKSQMKKRSRNQKERK